MPDAFPTLIDSDAADRLAAQAVAQAAQTLIGTLRVAQALVGCRRAVDLAGLDGAVGVLCAHILDLDPQAARALQPTLVELLAELDRLDALMQRQAGP